MIMYKKELNITNPAHSYSFFVLQMSAN